MEPKWFPSVQENPNGQAITFVGLSTVDDLSYSPSQEEKSRDAAQVAATGRRSWKTIRGKGEAVWPPILEAALIEALQEYRSNEVQASSSKHGPRFPMRNKFISDFIFERTGKSRTAKQVGSRLQQLRDTCKDERILELIARGANDIKSEDSSSSYGGREDSESDRTATPQPSLVVYTQINIDGRTPSYQIPRIKFVTNDIGSPSIIRLAPLATPSQYNLSCSLTTGRERSNLAFFSNIVQFYSPVLLSSDASFTIYQDSEVVQNDYARLQMVSPPTQPNSTWFLYSCALIPTYWANLCQRADPSRITILQNVTSLRPSESDSRTGTTQDSNITKISIVYHFNMPEDPTVRLRPVASTELGRETPSSSSSSPFSSAAEYSAQPITPSPVYWQSGPQGTYHGSDAGYTRDNRSFHYSDMGNPSPIPTHMPAYMDNSNYHTARPMDISEVGVYDEHPMYAYSNSMHQPDGQPRSTQRGLRNELSHSSSRDAMPHSMGYSASCY